MTLPSKNPRIIIQKATQLAMLFFFMARQPFQPRPSHRWGFEITLRHSTSDRTPPYERSARRRYLYPTKQNTSFIPLAGFEPAVPASERLQAHSLDHATTAISCSFSYLQKITYVHPIYSATYQRFHNPRSWTITWSFSLTHWFCEWRSSADWLEYRIRKLLEWISDWLSACCQRRND